MEGLFFLCYMCMTDQDLPFIIFTMISVTDSWKCKTSMKVGVYPVLPNTMKQIFSMNYDNRGFHGGWWPPKAFQIKKKYLH